MGWMRATIPGAPEAPMLGALHARGRAPQDIECTFDARLGRIIDPHLAKGQEFSPSETRWRSTTREELVPKGGLEPPRVAPHAPQTCASASSATSAMRGRSIPLPHATDKPPDPLPQARVERVANPLAQKVVREDRDEDRESRVHGQPPADLDRVLALVEDVAPGRVRRLDAEPEERQARLGQDRGG